MERRKVELLTARDKRRPRQPSQDSARADPSPDRDLLDPSDPLDPPRPGSHPWYDGLVVRCRISDRRLPHASSVLIVATWRSPQWPTAQAADIGTRADADALERKIVQIATNGLAQTAGRKEHARARA